ncbi:MAG: histidine phosphatase family protein [Muribaculaceae bacterium]|nr:histidine phosphatase family protein [Muribaculaceae bacterium]
MKCIIITWLLAVIPLLGSAAKSIYQPLPPELDGTMMTYDFTQSSSVEIPDSLTPFHIEYVARHGARYLSSSHKTEKLQKTLIEAESNNNLTSAGHTFLSLLEKVNHLSEGKWGALSAIGEEEERKLAEIMAENWKSVFDSGRIIARATFVPRVVASMDAFTLSLNTRIPQKNIYSISGPVNSPLLRFFDTNATYSHWLHPELKNQSPVTTGDSWEEPLKRFEDETLPAGPAGRLFKVRPAKEELQKISAEMYGVLQGLRAASIGVPTTQWFSVEEYRACWECANVEHYLRRSLNSISSLPMSAVAPLLIEIISNADKSALSPREEIAAANLMFGHAETLLPLAALMNLPGAVALPLSLNDLAGQWQDYNVTPLGANILLTLARHKTSGIVYARVALNGRNAGWLPWHELRAEWLERIAQFSL